MTFKIFDTLETVQNENTALLPPLKSEEDPSNTQGKMSLLCRSSPHPVVKKGHN